ncbi:MAG: capsular polysaccharide synthesis protein [Treponema sp.]|nr:capsular polysaccharide synthesis protein [Treponema sp.]
MINWLSNNFNYFISEYKKEEIAPPVSGIPKQIWICWWDGIDSMPPIVRACYNSVLRNTGDFCITVISKFNYNEFISIPGYILEKVNSGIMTITHFSNIIRMSLLGKYGGLWLDATILVTGKIDFENLSFFTIRGDFGGEDVPKRRWTGNCIGGASNIILFNFIREFLFEYWKKHDIMIDYFLYDYSITLAYISVPEIKEIIDGVKKSNKNYMFLQDYLEKEFNRQLFDDSVSNTVFHKLSWKNSYPDYDSSNKLTLFGYLLNEYYN